MSKQPAFDLDKAHHWFGVEYNNSIFPLLEKENRSAEETEKMIAMAFASTLHWKSYSKHTPANSARGEYMISTVSAYAGRKEDALHYALRSYDTVWRNKIVTADFDLSYALMALARAYALNGDMDNAQRYYGECESSIKLIKREEDKKIVLMDINSGPWYGLK